MPFGKLPKKQIVSAQFGWSERRGAHHAADTVADHDRIVLVAQVLPDCTQHQVDALHVRPADN